MTRKTKSTRSKSAGLRTWRQKIDLEGAVIAGSPKTSSIVYCYSFPSCPGRVKIGYSSRGLARVAEQSTAFPEKPKVLFVIRDPRAKDIESAFHIALADRQSDVMGTEWFDAGWPELLRVSPTLRRALGVGRFAWWVRLAATLCLLAAGMAMTPALMASISGVVKGLEVGRIADGFMAYAGTLARADLARSFEMAGAMRAYAFSGDISPAWPLLGVVHLPILAWLPWRRRRQAY